MLTVQIQKKYYTTLVKSLREIAGFKDCFLISKITDLEDNVEVEIIFYRLQRKYRKYLEKYLKRRKAKIISDTDENNGLINPESKKAIANGLVASGLVVVATVFSINGFSSLLSSTPTFYDSLVYSIGPALGSFLSTLLIYYKR